MKVFEFTALLSCTLLFSGCSGASAPKCSDTDTIELVKNIASKQFGTPEMQKSAGVKTDFSLDAIRTTGQNKETGAYQCAANLHGTISISELSESNTKDWSITYESALTDDGKQYVTVNGL
jgi:hypothetical protein